MKRIPVLLALLAALTASALASGMAYGQAAGPQIVDSLDAYERQLETVVDERLASLVPSGNYVLRVVVNGEQVPAQPGQASQGLALPGFQPAPGQQVQQLDADAPYRVDQVLVRVVVNKALAESELQYLRTIIPILADFRPERGDQLDLQMVAPASAVAEAQAREEEPPPQPEPTGLAALGMSEWILIGGLALVLLLLLVVLMRLLTGNRAQPQAVQPAPAEPPRREPSQAELDEQARQETEASRRERGRQQYLDSVRSSVVKGLFARNDLGNQLLENWQDDQQKLGVLFHALGPTVARQALLPNMSRDRYHALEQAVRFEDPPETDTVLSVLREANLFLITQEIAQPEQIEADPFSFLNELTPGQIGHLVKPESVRIKAIVLSRLKPEDTAKILETLPREVQLEVAVQIGHLQDLPLNMLEGVARDLAEKSRHVPDARTVSIEGPRTLVDLMTRASSETSRYLLQAMKSKDRKLSEQVERRYFRFEFIPQVPDEVLPNAVRTMPSSVVVQALQGADPEIARKVIMAFPEQARPGMVTTLRAAQNDQETVESARRQMVERFQSLAEQGRLDLKQISDAWQAEHESSTDTGGARAEAS